MIALFRTGTGVSPWRVPALRLARVLALGLPFVLAACAGEPPDLPTAAQLEILIPGPEIGPEGLPGEWTIAGAGSGSNAPKLTTIRRDGVPAIRFTAGSGRLMAIRQVHSPLLATPFLAWSWNLSPTSADVHPVRLVAGFRVAEEGAGAVPRRTAATALPDHQRLLTFVFGASALQRGTLARRPETADGGVYIVRGGRENTETWWVETADLEDLYRRLWPADDPAWVEVVFIGVLAEPAAARETASLSGIILSR